MVQLDNHQAVKAQCMENMQTRAQIMPHACEHSYWVWPPVDNCMVMVLWYGAHIQEGSSFNQISFL